MRNILDFLELKILSVIRILVILGPQIAWHRGNKRRGFFGMLKGVKKMEARLGEAVKVCKYKKQSLYSIILYTTSISYKGEYICIVMYTNKHPVSGNLHKNFTINSIQASNPIKISHPRNLS